MAERFCVLLAERAALEISGEAASWPEQGQREKRWMSPRQATELVEEADLKRLIHSFAESGPPATEGVGAR